MSELLSAEELNNLLTAVNEGDVPEGEGDAADGREIRPYDFGSKSRLSRDQLRAIERLHEEAAQALSSALGDLLRTPVEANVAGSDFVAYGAFNSALPVPVCLQLFRVEPPGRRGLLTVDISLALGIVDRLLGGQGEALDQPRPLTAVEQALLAKPIAAVLETLAGAWSNLTSVSFQPEAMAMDPREVQFLGVRDMVLQVTFAVGGDTCVGDIGFCLPAAVVDRLVPRERARLAAAFEEEQQAEAEATDVLRRAIGAAPLRVAVELGRARISALDLMNLQPGHVVRLDSRVGQPLAVTVEGRHRFTGQPGLVGKRLGVQLTRVPQPPRKGNQTHDE
ncbi:MAG: flagellar motor switch protein FliM [Candidatus Brocadiia bacterium]